jgi:hypothetical protein
MEANVVNTWWIVSSTLVLLIGSGSIFLLTKMKRFYIAQVLTVLFLMYALLLLVLWGTTSEFLFTRRPDMPPTLKRLLLAGAGGLLAQIALWLKRLERGKTRDHHVAPMYFDAVMGILSGVAAAAFLATYKGTLPGISDQQAAVAGVAGGALGIGFFDALKSRYLPSIAGEHGPAAAGPSNTRNCCIYAGQTYSHGSNVAMPAHGGGVVVKTCNGHTGTWKMEHD